MAFMRSNRVFFSAFRKSQVRHFVAAKISAKDVKLLRDQTGAPMMECKKALQHEDVQGDVEKAVDWLRKHGIAAASKRSSKDAAEGLIALSLSPCKRFASVVELNSETDFVARNTLFQEALRKVADCALSLAENNVDKNNTTNDSQYKNITNVLLEHKLDDGTNVSEMIAELGGTVRENILLSNAEIVSVGSNSSVTGYIHNQFAPNMGTMACIVGLEDGNDTDDNTIANQIALHVTAAAPKYLTVNDIPEDDLEREASILREQGLASGKPADIVEKMVTGRMKKFHKEFCLIEQEFIVDDSKRTVKKVLKDNNSDMSGFLWKKVGGSGSVSGF
jgi:elongation factor Ts